MATKEVSTMEEGQAGLSLNQGSFSVLNPFPCSQSTEQSPTLPLNYSEISQPPRDPQLSDLFTQGSTEETQSGSNSSWQTVVNLFRQRKTYRTEDAVPRENGPELREPIVRGLEQCATGYPRLAAFLDSDDNFMIYRRFGFLSSRILLDQQDKLRLLEEDLDTIDQNDAETNPHRNLTRDLLEEDNKERQELLVKIKREYCEYAKFLCAARDVMSFNKPAGDEWRSVENYIWNRKQVEEQETKFIYHKEDLVTLRPGREHAWLDRSVERLLRWLNCDLIEWTFCSKESRQKSKGIEVYYSRSRIENVVATIITSVILILLIVPIYLLYHFTSILIDAGEENVACVGILVTSTLLFSAIISVFTRAKRHEIFAASAAYCAVLVVFIGNIGGRVGMTPASS